MEDAKNLEEQLSEEQPCEDLISLLRRKHEDNKDDTDITLQFAMALSKCKKTTRKEKAIRLFSSLLDDSKHLQEAQYGIALTYFSMGHYSEARSAAEEMLRQSPDNAQARRIHRASMYRMEERDNLVNIGLGVGAGVAVAAAAFVVASVMRKR